MIKKKLILSLSLLLLAGSIAGCGKEKEAETTEATTAIATEAETETETEATTEEQNEAEKLGYDKTFLHETDFGGKYAIPEKFVKTNEESVETGLWYEFTDKDTGIVLETWEDPRRTRRTDYFAATRDSIKQYDYNTIKDEEDKIVYTGYDKDLNYFIEIDTLYDNVYHYITLTCPEDKKDLCTQIADIVDSKTEYISVPEVSGRLPLLLYGGWYSISDEEIASFTDEEVKEAINEMYAYKGLAFEEQDLLEYYKGYGWYNPTVAPKDFSESKFSDTEKENLKKLKARVDYTPSGVPSGTTEEYTPAVAGERFEMVRGGSYFVPEGFDNITQETYAVRYVQEWQNYSLDMYITVTNCMQHDIPITLDEEYASASSQSDNRELSLDKKEADGYILSGTYLDTQRIFYQKVKNVEDRYVSFYIEYPASNADTCNKILEDFVANFDYYN